MPEWALKGGSVVIFAWARTIANQDRCLHVEPHHLVLAALKTSEGRVLVTTLMGARPDLSKLDPKTRELLVGSLQPKLGEAFPVGSALRALMKESGWFLTVAPAGVGKTIATWIPAPGAAPGDFRQLLARCLQHVDQDDVWGPRWRGLFGSVSGGPSTRVLSQGLRRVQERISQLRLHLTKNVLGQDGAVEQVVDAYFPHFVVGQSGEGGRRGPRMILTFAGPSGVGKTLMAESLAAFFDEGGARGNLLRLDMSSYSGHQAHEQLIGGAKMYSNSEEGILNAFISKNADGVILVDEVEKAHRNCINLFLQILEHGEVFDNHVKKMLDFSQTTFIFTTNLGAELYDSPNRSGVLRDSATLPSVVLSALEEQDSVGLYGESRPGLPKELVSRLSKGAVVLFDRLDAISLDRMARATFDRVSEEFFQQTGIRLELGDSRLPMMWLLRFGAGGDARRLISGLKNHLYGAVSNVLGTFSGLVDEESRGPALGALRFELCADSELPDPVRKGLEGPSTVLLIDDDDWCRRFPQPFACVRAVDEAGIAAAITRQMPLFVLLDLHIGAKRGDGDFVRGLAILSWLRQRYPDIPVYLFSESPDRRGLSASLLEHVRTEGGARGLLKKAYYADEPVGEAESDPFFDELAQIEQRHRRDQIVRYYHRRSRVVHFDTEPALPMAPDGVLRVVLCRCREVTAVTASDRKEAGWCEVPEDRFESIAGADEAKERLMEVVCWLKDPGPLRAMGVDLPRGILMTGPPGTGKTSLARAVAGEAEAPFFAVSGTELFSKWAGEGEAKIRNLFQRARRYAPSVVFIDEIDSLGRARGAEDGEYRENMLAELLAQLDGFVRADNPVFVLAATNRPDVLDAALLRPGRFDLQVEVGLPGPKARLQLLNRLLQRTPTPGNLDLGEIVTRTSGFSGAELKQVVHEAARLALRQGKSVVQLGHLDSAVTTVRMGPESRREPLPESAKRQVAIHEVGHAVVQHRLMPEAPLTQLSILPRGSVLGFAEHQSDAAHALPTRKWVEARLAVLVAGRVAESMFQPLGDVSAGCANDLARATALAMKAVGEWGMDEEFGFLSMGGIEEERVGRGIRNSVGAEAMEGVRRWLKKAEEVAKGVLEKERKGVLKVVERVMEVEVVKGEDVGRMVG